MCSFVVEVPRTVRAHDQAEFMDRMLIFNRRHLCVMLADYGVAALHSVRARERPVPLAAVLEARPASDHRELARMARHVTTLRPA